MVKKLLVARSLDIGTTYIFIKTWGLEMEANPIGKWLLGNIGFVGFILLNLAIVLTLAYSREHRLSSLVILVLTVCSFTVAGWNLFWILFPYLCQVV